MDTIYMMPLIFFEHYTWEFMREIKSGTLNRNDIHVAIDKIDKEKVAEIVKQWLHECVSDYPDVKSN